MKRFALMVLVVAALAVLRGEEETPLAALQRTFAAHLDAQINRDQWTIRAFQTEKEMEAAKVKAAQACKGTLALKIGVWTCEAASE